MSEGPVNENRSNFLSHTLEVVNQRILRSSIPLLTQTLMNFTNSQDTRLAIEFSVPLWTSRPHGQVAGGSTRWRFEGWEI